MSGYLPAGVTQDALDRLIDDEEPDMEWDSIARQWVPAGTNDGSEEEQQSEPESPRKPVAVAKDPSEFPRCATGAR